jgi:hypothetical protein
MAHFAELDDNNKVLRVVVVNNAECIGSDGIESEEIGVAFCQSLYGGTWKQTSYNGSFRKNFAGLNSTYDPVKDVFIPAKPEESLYEDYVLDEVTLQWVPPIPMPTDGKQYAWDYVNKIWAEVPPPDLTPLPEPTPEEPTT